MASPQLSCYGCRNKKVKCDRVWPACGRCTAIGDTCKYPGSRQVQSGKRKQVRDLEDRLNQIEHELSILKSAREAPPPHLELSLDHATTGGFTAPSEFIPSNELIGLGLFEQLPSHQLIEDLTNIYFDKMYHAAPMLYRPRYTASLHHPSHKQPPMCLQYIVMALAAETDQTYRHLALPFYHRARTYADADEMRGQGDGFITVAHVQFWTLVSYFEAHHLMFPRASTSVSKSIRIAHMLGLHLIDQDPRTSPQTLVPSADWAELEERRRTWWAIFCTDRFVTATTGWPALINDSHISTLLPASEEAFSNNREQKTTSLKEALRQSGTCQYSAFAGRVLAAHLFHQTLQLTRETAPADGMNDSYWQRHTEISNDLSTLLMFLPAALQLPRHSTSQNAVFTNIIIHAAMLSLHRTAVSHSQSHANTPENRALNLSENTIRHSRSRLLPTAEDILNIIRMVIDIKTAFLNPLMVFAAYTAALVFLDEINNRQNDRDSSRREDGVGSSSKWQTSEANLNFLLNIMIALGGPRHNNPVTRSLAIQLATEMRRSGIDSTVMDRVEEELGPLEGEGSPPIMVPLLSSPPGAPSGIPASYSHRLPETSRQASNVTFCIVSSCTEKRESPRNVDSFEITDLDRNNVDMLDPSGSAMPGVPESGYRRAGNAEDGAFSMGSGYRVPGVAEVSSSDLSFHNSSSVLALPESQSVDTGRLSMTTTPIDGLDLTFLLGDMD